MGQTIFYESNNFGDQKAKTKIGHPALMLGRDVHKL
jgi:hypothetical protein